MCRHTRTDTLMQTHRFSHTRTQRNTRRQTRTCRHKHARADNHKDTIMPAQSHSWTCTHGCVRILFAMLVTLGHFTHSQLASLSNMSAASAFGFGRRARKDVSPLNCLSQAQHGSSGHRKLTQINQQCVSPHR